MKTIMSMTISLLLILSASVYAQATRDYISIVGSSTVYPFSTVVAEQFGKATQFKTPKIESTGTGGGIKLFCAGVGVMHPDIANASRAVKKSEIELCAKNGVTEIIEVKFGYDGIVLAHANNAPDVDISLKDLFLAFAKQTPTGKGDELAPNPYKTWKDINSAYPDFPIKVLGPPPTSGTRDAFVEMAMEGGCKQFDWIKALKETNEDKYKAICHGIREDGAYIDAGENDTLIIKKIEADPKTFGILGYSFLEQNSEQVKGSKIDGVEPTFENISANKYAISRPLYFYVKKAHIGMIPGLKEYMTEFTSDKANGEEGYLVDRGLIPLHAQDREAVKKTITELKSLK
jgi:phosphate transport system substrate-binding protein